MDLEEEERQLGSWPRRLLHVSTLTSYAWQPGNVYNGSPSPKYNAISYTWGRWRLDESDQPHVNAIPISIDNDDWSIPRIDPKHFTVDEFRAAILAAATLPVNRRDPDPVDFVWLDVACIHQGRDPRSVAEIGRQALVFQGAKSVFIWLTKQRHRVLERLLDDMWWLNRQRETEFTPLHRRAIRNIFLLLADPWVGHQEEQTHLRHRLILLEVYFPMDSARGVSSTGRVSVVERCKSIRNHSDD
jgi:hypothetical protein